MTPTATLLVVDDTPASLYATCRVLRQAGFTILEASNGEQAVAIAREQNVDVMVLDINLPGLNGYQVCREIRAQPDSSAIRVVYLSASYVDDRHKIEGYEAGADGFLTHPVEAPVLIATVKAQLRTRAIERELELLLQRERAARRDAEAANRVKDEFLATLSHELRSPLNAILGWAEVARLQKPAPEIARALEVIIRNARFQTRLISDLLDVSRITTGKLELDLQPVALADTVRAVIDTMRSAAQTRSIRIESTIQDVGNVSGDPTRLEQIVSNLLSNAIKFSNPSDTVSVTLTAESEHACLTIRDHGRGIEPEALPRVFERFWQADASSRRSFTGLGLGLAIVKHLTEQHHGTAAAQSDGLGHGATFIVTLPLQTDGATEPSHAESPTDVERAAVNLAGMRVLIVDDDTDGRRWVRHIVSGAGATAMDVGDVGSALRAVDTFVPHVLISDLAMPHEDGFDLVGFLRDRGHTPDTLPVIALSAFADPEHKRRALAATFHSFLSKPPQPSALLEALATLKSAE